MSIHTMTLGQNLHMMPNNCVIVSNHFNKSQPMYSHGKRPIAPAPTVLTSNGANQVINIPKKKYNYGSMQYPATQTASVARRNARERNRVKQVNNGFSNLRQHIPSTVISSITKGSRGSAKKLSKVDTLKLAVEYIRRLKDMLEDNENSSTAGSSSSYYSENSQQLRSEASLSPTPSYSSDASSTISYTPNHMQGLQTFKQEPFDSNTEPSTSPAPSYHSDIPIHHQPEYLPTSTPYKPVHHNYNYSPVSADDEDLLDAITWWQQQ
jgi:achaete-scute complex protein